MSAATIERELAEYLALSDYEVRFRPAMSYSWFYVYVFYRGKTVTFKSCCRSYPRAARWARRQIRRHEKAMRDLGPLVRP